MDMALDTVSQSALDLGQRLETILRRGHLYENVVASGNSNVHNGDRIYVTCNVTYNTRPRAMAVCRCPPTDILRTYSATGLDSFCASANELQMILRRLRGQASTTTEGL